MLRKSIITTTRSFLRIRLTAINFEPKLNDCDRSFSTAPQSQHVQSPFSRRTTINGFERHAGAVNSLYNVSKRTESGDKRLRVNNFKTGHKDKGSSRQDLSMHNEVKKNTDSPSYACTQKIIAHARSVTPETVQETIQECRSLINGLKSLGKKPNIFTYTALVKVYTNCGMADEAMSILEEMRKEGVAANCFTYGAIINGYALSTTSATAKGTIAKCRSLMKEMTSAGFPPDVVIYGSFLKIFTKGGLMEGTMDVLEEMKQNNISLNCVIYNILIDGYAQTAATDDGRDALHKCKALKKQMIEEGITPTNKTYGALLNACAKVGSFKEAKRIFAEMEENGIQPDIVAYNTLINCLGKQMTDNNSRRIAADCDAIVEAIRKAELKPKAETYGNLIKIYSSAKKTDSTIQIFEEMQSNRIRLNLVVSTIMINCLAETVSESNARRHLQWARDIIESMKLNGPKPDVTAFTALAKMYVAAGMTDDAFRLLTEMRQNEVHPNVVTYNTLFTGLGRELEARNPTNTKLTWETLTRDMKKNRIKPIPETYSILDRFPLSDMQRDQVKIGVTNIRLHHNPFPKTDSYIDQINTLSDSVTGETCNQTVQECRTVMNEMMKRAGAKPDLAAYTALAKVYSKAGDMVGAVNVLDEMRSKGIVPNVVTYTVLMNGYAQLASPEMSHVVISGGRQLVVSMKMDGVKLDRKMFMALLMVYMRCGEIKEAMIILESMRLGGIRLDAATSNAIIRAIETIEDSHAAGILLTRLSRYMRSIGMEIDVQNYGSMIAIYTSAGLHKKATEVRTQMREKGIKVVKAKPDSHSIEQMR